MTTEPEQRQVEFTREGFTIYFGDDVDTEFFPDKVIIKNEDGDIVEVTNEKAATIRSQKTKEEFIKYLEEHPEERFWQSVRNFSGYYSVLVANIIDYKTGELNVRDTFSVEEK